MIISWYFQFDAASECEFVLRVIYSYTSCHTLPACPPVGIVSPVELTWKLHTTLVKCYVTTGSAA